MLRAPLSLFKKAAGWLAPEVEPVPQKPHAPVELVGAGGNETGGTVAALEVVAAAAPSEEQAPVPNAVERTINPERVGKYAATERFTIISAVYNVGRYLDDYFTTLVNQTADFWSCIEVIVVDDGSTDDSAEICRSWVERYPSNIRYLKQENAGQGAARNHGLRYARNDWVTFADPDDFISQDYFEQIDKAIKKSAERTRPLRLISANFIFYFEDTGEFRDGHPLRYRYAKGDVVLPASNPGKHVVLSVNNNIFWRRQLLAERLTFDPLIRPGFEDAHFVNRYLLSLQDADITFLTAPKYYYRKRSDASSTIDTGWRHPGRYNEQLRYGSLGLIQEALQRKGSVPTFVQRTVMYDLAWHIKRLVNDDPLSEVLDEQAIQEYRKLMFAVMEHVSEETIMAFELASIWFFHKVGVLSVFKDKAPSFNIAYCTRYDEIKCLLEIKYYSREEACREEVKIDGARVVPVYASTRRNTFLDTTFLYERSLWISVGDGRSIKVGVEGKPTQLSIAAKAHRDAVPVQHIVSTLRNRAVSQVGMPEEVLALRRAARDPAAMRKYGGCWLLMDRDLYADDNAEHLYRYLAQEHPEVRAYFVLRSDSLHWPKLMAEGFRLIEFGSYEHKLALLNAAHLVSSHADQYIFGDLEPRYFKDLLSYRFTFLQHGVIQNDLSGWLNTKEIACFVTTTKSEYDSIAYGESYKFSPKEVALTGLPRHDRLAVMNREPDKVIVIMPTWRRSLMGPQSKQGSERDTNPEFHESFYAQSWGGLLRSPELKRMAEEEGYKIVFFPHTNIVPYIDGFSFPDHVEVRLADASVSIQDLFVQSAVMVTDYSSVAFEMACLERPVIYFQFDRDIIYTGVHTIQEGYFEYERDGLGPVCTTVPDVLGQLEQTLRARCKVAPKYLARIQDTFRLRDGQCCRRTYEAILALDTSCIPDPVLTAARLDFARHTFAFGEWQAAYDAWQSLRSSADVQPLEAVLKLAVCARKLGRIEECIAYVAEADQLGADPDLLRMEQVAVDVALGEYGRAVSAYEQWRRSHTPDAAEADFLVDIARAYRLTSQMAPAEALLNEISGAAHAGIEWEWAELASAKQAWEEAAERWSVLASSAKAAHAPLKWAEALLNLERPEDAREALARLAWDGLPLDVMRARAELAYKLLDSKSASKAWELVAVAGELTPDEWLKLAKAARKRGELEQAEQALGHAEGSTDLRTLLQERALLLSAQARWVEAVEAWQTFLDRRDLSPNRDAWLYLARAQMNVGELDVALRTVRRFARARGDTEESLALQADIENAIEQRAQTAQDTGAAAETSGAVGGEGEARRDQTPAEALA